MPCQRQVPAVTHAKRQQSDEMRNVSNEVKCAKRFGSTSFSLSRLACTNETPTVPSVQRLPARLRTRLLNAITAVDAARHALYGDGHGHGHGVGPYSS